MDLNSYNTLNRNELVAQYKLLVGRANWRAGALEKAGMTTTSAYKYMKAAASRVRGTEKARFSASVKGLSTRQIKARMNEVKRFLSDETSLPSGVRNVASKIGGTIKDRWGLELNTADEIKAVFEGALYKKLEAKYDPYIAMKTIAAIQRSDGTVKNILKELKESEVFVSETELRSVSGLLSSWKRWHGIDLFNDSEKE